MKTYITRINGWSLWDRSHYMQQMVAEIAHQLDCREMGIYRYYAEEESGESLSSRLDGIIAGINGGDIVICQFPTGNGIRFENELAIRLKTYGARLAIMLHELEALAEEEKKPLLGRIIGVYNQAEVLIVPSYAMQEWLLENGIRKSMKFVVQEMWDYTVNRPFDNTPALKKEIYFTDGEGFAGINEWNYSVTLKLYNVLASQGNVRNMGEREPYQLLSELNEGGGFGMVWYRDEHSRRYMRLSNSFSIARYLAAGLPVIVPAGISHQMLIEENHLGLVVDSLEEAAAAVERMTEGEYREYVKAVEQFAPALRNGYFTKKCLIEAMQAFYRKDAGRISIPEKIYEAGKNVFSSVSLNKSFGGKLAFSWEFQGEAEGFLIYDTEGILLGNTRDHYQHYISLGGQKPERGICIKAYTETLKGKLILAESEPVYLQKRHYDIPKVSMVVPAYNAENYIARCIDTILAQSLLDVQIIVVDDGSTDQTREVIDWYAGNYENIEVIHQENSGVAAARNTGIKHAKGEYIGFMDSDDLIYPCMVERLYRSAKKNDCDIAITSIYMVTETERVRYVDYPITEDEPISVDDFFPIYSYGDEVGVVVWNKLYRSTLVKDHLFPSISYEDNAWTPPILSYASRICYLNVFSYEWDKRIQNSSLSSGLSKRSAQEVFEDFKRATLYSIENGNPEKRQFLKEVARINLTRWENFYGYVGYGKLRDEIEENY